MKKYIIETAEYDENSVIEYAKYINIEFIKFTVFAIVVKAKEEDIIKLLEKFPKLSYEEDNQYSMSRDSIFRWMKDQK